MRPFSDNQEMVCRSLAFVKTRARWMREDGGYFGRGGGCGVGSWDLHAVDRLLQPTQASRFRGLCVVEIFWWPHIHGESEVWWMGMEVANTPNSCFSLYQFCEAKQPFHRLKPVSAVFRNTSHHVVGEGASGTAVRLQFRVPHVAKAETRRTGI